MMLIDLETAPVSSWLLLGLALAFGLWTALDVICGVAGLRASRARGRDLDVLLARLDAEIDGHTAVLPVDPDDRDAVRRAEILRAAAAVRGVESGRGTRSHAEWADDLAVLDGLLGSASRTPGDRCESGAACGRHRVEVCRRAAPCCAACPTALRHGGKA